MAHRLLLLAILASCRDETPERSHAPPTSTPTPQSAPPLTEQQKQDIGDEIVRRARVDATIESGPCTPITIDHAKVTGKLYVDNLGGKTIHTAVGILEGDDHFDIYGGESVPRGRTTLRARRDPQDHSRPLVIMITNAGHSLDAVSGAVVIDKATPDLVGHVENAEFRQVREDYSYVDGGCTGHVGRIDFEYRLTPH